MLEILYHDAHLVAVNKPSGLLVHRSMIDRHETRFALQLVRDQIGQRVYPVHRLDKPTSGVLLFALSPAIARQVSELFSARETQKHYLSVVRGYTQEHDIIDYPLKEQLDKIADHQADPTKAAQPAITEYQCLATLELPYPVGRYPTARYSLIKLSPKTGRKHQIRRHMKHIFHPIVGDTTHGDSKHNQLFRDIYDSHRLLLHAHKLAFIHPVSGQAIEIAAPLDESFSHVIAMFDSQMNIYAAIHTGHP
ncbi:MAG: tRNA pseudouridine(65) synthase TruC [Gammaproteobacteria bacterium]|nr:tRNA pseudouridine(65) synthase TruC [Gammaproteobacteria bacterium]